VEAVIAVGRLAERIFGHRLPSNLLRSGSFDEFRKVI
jgi:hypothetical protein